MMTNLDGMGAMVVVLVALVALVAHRANVDKDSKFNLADAFLDDNGKTNMTHVLMFGAWIIASWAMVAMVVSDQLTEWFLAGYLGAFVLNSIGRKFAEKKQDAPNN